MTAPICPDVAERLKAMRDPVINLLFIRIGFGVGLADTLGDDLWIAILVARVLAVRALHAWSILEQIATVCTTHDVVKGLQCKLVAILLDDVFFLLTDSTLSTQCCLAFLTTPT